MLTISFVFISSSKLLEPVDDCVAVDLSIIIQILHSHILWQ